MMYVEFMKNFLLADSSELLAVSSTHFGILRQRTFDSYFLDMMFVEFKEYFLLAERQKYFLLDSYFLD